MLLLRRRFVGVLRGGRGGRRIGIDLRRELVDEGEGI